MLVPVLKDMTQNPPKESSSTADSFEHPLQEDLDLLNLEDPVAGLALPKPAEQAEVWSKPGMEPAPPVKLVRHPEIGRFSTETDNRNPGKPITTGSVTREVFFDNSELGKEPPSCAVALTGLDLSNQKNIRVVAKQELSSEFVKVSLATWNNSVLYSASCDWLEIGEEHEDWQHGSFNIRDYGKAKKTNWRRIPFERTFSAPPKVAVFLSEVDMDCWRHWRLKTYTSDITENGFTIHVDTWSDSILYGATATWIAYEGELPNIISGTASTNDIRSWKNPQCYNRGFVDFPEGLFSKTPRVFAGISGFDIACTKNLRLTVGPEKVNKLGMYWKADSWADTVQYWSELSYIAME